MTIFIPTLGDMLRLTEDWHFRLFHEYRNSELAEALKTPSFTGYDYKTSSAVVLPKGTILKVARIYIKGSDRNYDSLTFRTVASPDGRLASRKNGGTGKSRRFWAKLADVNTMEAERFYEQD